MKFKTHKIADISTAHVSKNDGELLSCENAPCHMAELDDGMGSVYWVPLGSIERSHISKLKKFGFSPAVIKLFKKLAKQGIPYVRFDADGAFVKGAKKFDW